MKWLVAVVLMGSGAAAQPSESGPQVLQFSLDRPGPAATQYTVTVRSDGQGVYLPHLAAPTASELPSPGEQPDAQTLHIAPALVKKLFAAVPMVEGGRCETHNKGIAKTGTKVLAYRGAGREAQCTYNYSDDDRVNDATTAFQAVAETMLYGQRLSAKLRFDRLGLDGELEGLQGAVDGGRALELGNIAPVLEAIRADERVMERVRRRAERLLVLAGGAQAGASTGALSER